MDVGLCPPKSNVCLLHYIGDHLEFTSVAATFVVRRRRRRYYKLVLVVTVGNLNQAVRR